MIRYCGFGRSLMVFLLIGVAACEAGTDGLEDQELPEAELEEESVAAGGIDFARWDTDRDQRLGPEEFAARDQDQGLFDQWDANADSALTGQELGTGLFREWDQNQDDGITEAEWEGAANVWFGTADFGAFYDWDLDDDRRLSQEEVARGVQERGLLTDMDVSRDRRVDRPEYREGRFRAIDADGDGYLDSYEMSRR